MNEGAKAQIGNEAIEPIPIRRLRAIQPGQEIVYYTGELEHDIEAAHNSPDYARLLGRIANLALELQERGRVRLVERKIKRGGINRSALMMTEYVAIGLPGRRD
jgi:hypothetical protein